MSARDDLVAKAMAFFAEHGAGDTSLRTLAAGIGTSHRMLNYHFGSREGLLAAVVEAVERDEQEALVELGQTHDDPFEAGLAFWTRVTDRAQVFAPLFFELSTHAMRRRPHAEALRRWLGEGWLAALQDGYARLGVEPERARVLALQSLAMARGLLFELATTGDRAAVDQAMNEWTDLVRREVRASAAPAAAPSPPTSRTPPAGPRRSGPARAR